MKKSYHEPIKSEEETTINVLYKEQVISVYTADGKYASRA